MLEVAFNNKRAAGL